MTLFSTSPYLLTEWWSQAKIYMLYHWDSKKIWLDSRDLGRIYKVTTL